MAAMVGGFTSCVGDLDLTPTDPNSITDVSKNMDQVFADVLFNFATYGPNGDSPVKSFDGGMATFQRALYIAEEMPTDEACWLWDPGDYGTLNYGKITPDLACAYGFYSRLTINVALCNQFIQQAQDGTFEGADLNDPKSNVNDYIRQCKILRSACYYYLMSLYSNPPYADETTPIGADFTQPGRAQVYENVTSCLEEIVSYYKQNPTTTYYGYVGLDVAESILAKIYLNGEVFANRADYDKCYQHSKAIIDRLGTGGYYGNGLARSYQALFGYNNDQYSVGHSGNVVNEIIWNIPQSHTETTQDLTSYAGATFLIAGWIGTNGVSPTVPYPTRDPQYDVEDANDRLYPTKDNDGNEVILLYKYCATDEEYDQVLKTYNETSNSWEKNVSEVIVKNAYSFDPKAVGYVSQQWYNAGDGWKCMVARKAFVKKFEWDDVEMSKSKDRRVAQWQTSAHGFTSDNPSLVGDDWGKNGYLAAKYTNWSYNEDGTIDYISSPSAFSQVGGDYAVIRLAEIYLTAAEAILQGGGGSQAEALQYVNYIRQRAYGDDITTTDDDSSWKWTSLSMTDLQNERCRELYSENVRRTDLIRWNLWTTGYTWEWKGGIESGTNLPEYTKSYPIPSRVMTSSSMQQIPGY